MKKITRLLLDFSAKFFPADEIVPPVCEKNYFCLIEEAKQAWRDAKNRFDQTADPDLVDHAIYAVEAAERRYVYLLKKARKEGFSLHLKNHLR